MTDHPNQEEIDSYLDVVFAYLRATERNTEFERVLTDSLNHATFINDVITEEEEKQLMEQPYDSNLHNTPICPILQTPFEVNEPVTVLPCNHVFNSDAIRTWLKQHNTLCPVCRFNLKSTVIEPPSVPDTPPVPLLSDTLENPPENVIINEYYRPYVTFESSDMRENEFNIYYNIYYQIRNNTLSTEHTLLHS